MTLDAARDLVREDGIDSLSVRKVATAIGYTPGTIYQHFDDMDRLVETMNIETLRALHEACRGVRVKEDVEANLFGLAEAFLGFAKTHKAEWHAVISFPYGPDHAWSAPYDAAVADLIGLLIAATASLYPAGDAAVQEREVRTLWAGLFGLFVLDSHGRLGDGVTVDGQVGTLISFYLAKRAAV